MELGVGIVYVMGNGCGQCGQVDIFFFVVQFFEEFYLYQFVVVIVFEIEQVCFQEYLVVVVYCWVYVQVGYGW